MKNVATITGSNGGHVYDGIGGSSQAYSFSSSRPIHPPKSVSRSSRPGIYSEMKFRLLDGYFATCLVAEKSVLGRGAVRMKFSASSTFRALAQRGRLQAIAPRISTW